ncbi:MAG: PTS transporter subunit EIIC [Liquorilactobacillus nagelii]|uniref:PTS sugar transporter subunit IIC n=1 Tax=Liquorilactobacillus nagelii TaxID=82688 RepID=UPI0039E8FA85
MQTKLLNFMQEKFIPKVNKITNNAWIKGIQQSIISILPFILVGSLVTLIMLLNNIKSNLIPDLNDMSTFTFGMLGLFLAFLIPYHILENYKNEKKILAGFTALALYLMLIKPTFVSDGSYIKFELARFGSGGMFLSIVVGLVVAAVMLLAAKFSFFSEDTVLPDFIVTWFDSLIPIAVLIFMGWLGLTIKNVDIFKFITWVFSPLSFVGQSYLGFVLIVFLYSFFYSFGISTWALSPIVYPVMFSGIAQNAALVSKGLAPTNMTTYEVFYSAFIAAGGFGFTITLSIMMMLFAKSQQLKTISRATFPAVIFNINEPLVFGAPIAFNPILMVPMWINGLLVPLIAGAAMKLSMVLIPAKVFQLWYIPFPISTYLTTGIKGVILFILLFVITWMVYFPFFKTYDKQLYTQEQASK